MFVRTSCEWGGNDGKGLRFSYHVFLECEFSFESAVNGPRLMESVDYVD